MSEIVKAIIDGVDIYEEFGIYVKTKDLAFPLPKTNYVEIEGADGSLDLSTALTEGEVKYHDREITFTLTGLEDVQKVRTDIASLLHGKTVKLTFSDDLGYFYEGRLWVETWTYLTSISEFEVHGKMKPFRFPNVETVFNIPVKGEATITLENDTDFRITPRVEVSNIPKNPNEVSFSWTGEVNKSTSVGKNFQGTTLITNIEVNPRFVTTVDIPVGMTRQLQPDGSYNLINPAPAKRGYGHSPYGHSEYGY